MGKGCEDAMFENEQDVMNDPSKTISEPIAKTSISYFKSTSASELMKSTQHRASFEGGGWGLKVKAAVNHLVKDTETTNALTVILTEYRKHKYNYVPASAWRVADYDLENILSDPELFYLMNGYFYVAGISTGSVFEGNLIYSSKSTTNLK